MLRIVARDSEMAATTPASDPETSVMSAASRPPLRHHVMWPDLYPLRVYFKGGEPSNPKMSI
jgi:hypothetical protein